MRDRALPPVVGSTENALRAVLERLLAPTPVRTTQQWIALNVAAGGGDIGKALKLDGSSAQVVIDDLSDAGLLERAGERWRPTSQGDDLLRAVGGEVKTVTTRLTTGVAEDQLDIAIDVLNAVRANAEKELTERATRRSPAPRR